MTRTDSILNQGINAGNGLATAPDAGARFLQNCDTLTSGLTSPPLAAPELEPYPPAPPARHKPRVLVVDDMVDLAELLVELMHLFGFDTEVACDGETALRLLSAGSFDAAIVDIDLPDTTGFDVVATASASGWLRRTRIVFSTGNRSGQYERTAARFAGSRLLWKPFAAQDLLTCLEGLEPFAAAEGHSGTADPFSPDLR